MAGLAQRGFLSLRSAMLSGIEWCGATTEGLVWGLAMVKLSVLLLPGRLDHRRGSAVMKLNKTLSLRKTADAPRRTSTPPAYDSFGKLTNSTRRAAREVIYRCL